VVDLVNRQLLVFRDPFADAGSSTGFSYRERLTIRPDAAIAALADPAAKIAVNDLLP